MKSIICLVAVICAVSSVSANFSYFEIYPSDMSRTNFILEKQLKEKLNSEKLEPVQTLNLLGSCMDEEAQIFGGLRVDELMLVSVVYNDECLDQSIVEEREETCKELNEAGDGSVIFDNLNRYCHDALEKRTAHCAQRKDGHIPEGIKEFRDYTEEEIAKMTDEDWKPDSFVDIYPPHKTNDCPPEQVKERLNSKKLDPAQTYDLLTSGAWGEDEQILGRTRAETLIMVSAVFPELCMMNFDEILEGQKETCNRLDTRNDGSIMADNLSRYCRDAVMKVENFCASLKLGQEN